ncbi:reverse transcriptase domain-containing protein [Marispirochaeta sp.]|uniref:reverse transcriptase domain-containing protein n=1 Tax=Marispirochaeta sp. TaxID=2038653 RepID=UPI0029C64D46|nr:reverse transcriptase domain-containing protein [Marispirochaeta sp.]
MGLIDSVAQILAIDEATVNQIADKAPSYYRTYRIPKRNRSGFRTIYHPAKQTKALQYAIITTLLSNLLISKIAYAYKYGLKSPLKENASQHSKYKYSLHIDFKDFFPSIKPKDLFKSLSKNDIILNEPEKVFLQNALFIRRKGIFELSIGAPSSPIISNIIMYDFDNEIIRIAKSLD